MLIEPKDFWKRLLKKYFIDSPKVTVMGKASKKEQEELTRMENERIAKQIEALGPEGLGVKHKILTEAIKINEIQPPVEVLTKLPIPDTNKISFHSIKSYTSDFKDNEKINFSKAPVYMYIDDLKTNFVYVCIQNNFQFLFN